MFLRVFILCCLLETGLLVNAETKLPSSPQPVSREDTNGRSSKSDTSVKPPPQKQNRGLKTEAPAKAEDSDFVIKHPSYKIHLTKPEGGLGKNGKPAHSSRKAWMLSTVLPGTGQIYNRRYWKLPIVYGGIAGVIYGISFNQKLYNQYLQYYKVLLVNPAAPTVPEDARQAGATQVGSIKNYYRRNRDLFIIGGAALMLANAIDAYVDSELKNFDVSNKLTLHIGPWIEAPSQSLAGTNTGAYGLRISMRLKHSY